MISAGVKSADKDLAKVQTFLLDSMALLSSLLEKGDSLSVREAKNTVVTAVEHEK